MTHAEFDSQVMNYVVRMVVPLKREFGRTLDVNRFVADAEYRRLVLDEARGSRDARLRDYAAYVETRQAGARSAAPVPASALPAAPAAAAATNAAAPATEGPSEEELRRRMLAKYTQGLR